MYADGQTRTMLGQPGTLDDFFKKIVIAKTKAYNSTMSFGYCFEKLYTF